MEEKEIEKLLEPWGWTLMSSANVLIDANENLRILAQRLGRLIPKFEEVDPEKFGIVKWMNEYMRIKSTVQEAIDKHDRAYKSAFESEAAKDHPIKFNSFISGSYSNYSIPLSRFRARICILDDIIDGLLDAMLSGVIKIEASEKDAFVKAVKDNAEKTKEIPDGMYA